MERRRGRAFFERAPASARARTTVRGVVLLQIVANGLGMTVIALYLRFLVPLPNNASQTELNLLAFLIYLGTIGLIALPINIALLRRAVRWVGDGRPPTSRQRWLVFRLPLFETLSALVSWIGAAALFGVLNRDATRVSVAILLSGLVTCTLLYLLLEGHFRPVFALALADADLPDNRRDVLPRLMLAWFLGSGVPLAALGLSTFLEPAAMTRDRLAWLSGAGVVGGGVVMGAAAISVARPLGRVRNALRRVEMGELGVSVPVDDLGELGRLAEGVNDLVAGLAEREQLREIFSRQVGRPELIDLASGDLDGHLPAQRLEVTVLFVDLIGYTRYSEQRTPEEVVAMLNRFFRVVVAVVNREGGWVNKFEGDAALCIFGAPVIQPDHAARALRAAATISRELERESDVLPPGIGVATGEALAGFIGTAERFEYTVIGDVVNLTSRLCELSKDQRSRVLVSAVTLSTALDHGLDPDEWRSAGMIRVRGRRDKAPVATLTEHAGAAESERTAVSSGRSITQPLTTWRLDLAMYALAAAFTAANAAWARLDPHRLWGQMAVAGAVLSLLAAAALPHRRVAVWLFATAACVVLPLVALTTERAEGVANRAQSEVIVIERAGERLVSTGSPYLDARQIDVALRQPRIGVRAYVAYGTTMALFGLPRAWLGVHWWTDARIWFAMFAAAVTAAAARIGLRGTGGRLRVAQAMTIVPPAALTIATGGDDLPMVALCLLGLALGANRRWRAAALVFGLAVSMKYLALPVAVTAAWWALHDGHSATAERRRNAGWVAAAAVAVPAATMAPALIRSPGAVLENLVRYPLGLARRASTAASPLPGRLIAEFAPGGKTLAVVVLLAGALVVMAWMWRNPPVDDAHAAGAAAVALAVATLLAPSPRFGYLIHPIVLATWWYAVRGEERSPRHDAGAPVPSPSSA